jgi:hypothetical protein
VWRRGGGMVRRRVVYKYNDLVSLQTVFPNGDKSFPQGQVMSKNDDEDGYDDKVLYG